MNSRIYRGWVRHRRIKPRAHAFQYRLFMMYLDLAELDQVFRGRWFWSTRRAALARFRRRHHMGNPDVPLDRAVRDLVEQATGCVWRAEVSPETYDHLKVQYPIISTIPSGAGWEIQFVGNKPDDLDASPVEPNLEHAYVHYMENKLQHWNLE